MAYVVARPRGRFEVRESLHTSKGPRARTLAGFDVLTDEVLGTAAARAQRPFDPDAIVASARRAGARVDGALVEIGTVPTRRTRGIAGGPEADSRSDAATKRFVDASRRMALSMRTEPHRQAIDPGDALIDLLGFADEVARAQPPRSREPLRFPVLARLVEARRGMTDSRSR